MELRNYTPADAEALAEVYRDAARTLGLQGYTDEQTRVWAMHPEDLEEFRATLSEGLTLCAVVEGGPVAFGQIHHANHIAYMYCRPAYSRRGYASAILRRLEEHARLNGVTTLLTEASCVARPFFEHFGYGVVEEERPERHGVEFLRYRLMKEMANHRMNKILTTASNT